MSPVNSKLGVSTPHVEGTVIGGETLTLSTTSGTLAGQHSATIPSGTTRILCIPAATVYWGNNKIVTSSTGYTQLVGKGFTIEHAQISSAQVIADSGTPTMVVVYFGTPR
jgi:hypothetical protein